MTREEAIKFGKRVLSLSLFDETHEFCEIAVKALEQEPILDKIRAEIEPTRKMYLEMNDIDWLNGCDYVLQIIDKYKAEGNKE